MIPPPPSPGRKRVAVLASGRGSNLEALIRATHRGRVRSARVELVVVNEPGARALNIATESGIHALLIDHRPFGKDRAAHEAAIVRELQAHRIDLVVLAGYMRLLEGTLLDAFPGRVINIHPSLLPAFRGAHAQRDAIDYGVHVSGCTVHFVTREMDAGPVILQRSVPVFETDTEATLAARILEQEHEALPEAVELLAAGRLVVNGRRVVHLPPRIRPSLFIATGNSHKLREFAALLAPLDFDLRSAIDMPNVTDPVESGASYRENARIKARHWQRASGLWSLGDDSGLEVEALGGRPGLKTARYAASPVDGMRKLLEELKGQMGEKRRARFVCALALAGPNGELFEVEATCEGAIALEARGEEGFGYDPVFIPDGYGGKHLAELPEAIKNTMSHRGKAVEALLPRMAEVVSAVAG